MAQIRLVSQGLLLIQESRSHSDTPHSIGLLWMSDKSDAESSNLQHNAQMWQTYVPPQSQQVIGPRPTP